MNFLCSVYAPTIGMSGATFQGNNYDKKINITSVGNIQLQDSAYTDADTFKAAVAGQTIVYNLATPTTIQLTPTEVQTLPGSNMVWTDCGSVTKLEYRADTALYIQKLLNGSGTLSMASPSPSLSLGRVGVLAEPEASEPEGADEEAEQLEQTEEPEQTEEE